MKDKPLTSIYHDTRRQKTNGTYPVKIRVFTPSPRKQKLYTTSFSFTKADFEAAYEAKRTKPEWKETKRSLTDLLHRADAIINEMGQFTFEEFDRKFYRKAGDGIKINYHYDRCIEDFESHGQLNTVMTYELSRKSLSEFAKYKKQEFKKLTFRDIDKNWLNDYEYYMTEVSGELTNPLTKDKYTKAAKSLTTVSMYVRTLRAVYNRAIDEGEIDRSEYPFGKRRYKVPAVTKVKKALNGQQLKALFHAEPITPEQQKAKDFWFFSYALNGINIKDIALLKWSDIADGCVTFIRAKTRHTAKANLKAITVYLNEYAYNIIELYGNKTSGFIFDIIEQDTTPAEQKRKIKNFTRFINQHIKKLCTTNDLPGGVSTYFARHSWASNAIRKGASMEFVQESFGHSDLKTTQNYFAGFDNETKKEFAETLMDF